MTPAFLLTLPLKSHLQCMQKHDHCLLFQSADTLHRPTFKKKKGNEKREKTAERRCPGLNQNGPNRLIFICILSPPFMGGVSLLEVSYLRNKNVKLLASAPCLSASQHDDKGLAGKTVRKPPIKCFLVWKMPRSRCLFTAIGSPGCLEDTL